MRFSARLTAVLLVLAMLFSAAAFAGAEELPADDGDQLAATKTDERTDRYYTDLQYEVTLSVPGNEDRDSYSEIIVMVDGSISTGYTDYYAAGSEFKAEMALIKSIGEKALREDGRVKLTLMGFGYSAKLVATYTRPEELDAIDELKADDFLYGVSATNCEGAMSFINDYIKAQPDELQNVVVVFASDGEANLDDEPFMLSAWKENSKWWSGGKLANVVNNTAVFVMNELRAGYEPLDEVKSFYPDECEAIAAAKKNGTNEDVDAAIASLGNAVKADSDKAVRFIDTLFADALAAYKNEQYPDGMAYDKAYPSSHVEHAIVDYFTNGDHLCVPAYVSYGGEIALDKNGNPDEVENIAYAFYLAVINYGSGCADYYYTASAEKDPITGYKYAQRRTTGLRAAAMCDRLCENEKVRKMILVGYPARTSTQGEHWMNPEATEATTDGHVTSSKAEFRFAAGSVEALGDVEQNFVELLRTMFSDPYIVDPMSEWVNFDPETADIRIYDYEECIYSTAKGGWLIDEKDRPVKTKDPVKVEINEETGRYQITWYVKEGALSATDLYKLRYYVTVNEQAEGYKMGTEYPANDDTFLFYDDNEGVPVKVAVDVPPVEGPFSITKLWIGKDGSHDPVTVYITANGEKVAPVTVTDTNWTDGSRGCVIEDGDIVLSEENGWTVKVFDLPYTDINGDEIEYAVVEKETGTGYKCEVKGSVSEGFTVVNTYTGGIPGTGDTNGIWLLMMLVSGAGLVLLKKKAY